MLTSNKSVSDVIQDWIPKTPKPKKNPVRKGNNFTALYLWLGIPDGDASQKSTSGNMVEDFIKKLVMCSYKNPRLLTEKKIKTADGSKRQVDLQFLLNGTLHYREIKGNVNLDTEKMKGTLIKIDAITIALNEKYQSVDAGILCPAWLDSGVKNTAHIEGFNDFIDLLGYTRLSVSYFDALGLRIG
jgi:hypothetical protein